MRIVSIDFETANRSPISACAIGLAIFENGELIDSPYWLVKPPKGHGFFIPEWTEEIHGLSWLDVRDAPEFSGIAPEVCRHLANADLVIAHNTAFDMKVLRHTLAYFSLPQLSFRYLCTLQLSRQIWPILPNHKLSTLATHIGCELNHHHAQSDAVAAGRVLLAMLSQINANNVEELCTITGFQTELFRTCLTIREER